MPLAVFLSTLVIGLVVLIASGTRIALDNNRKARVVSEHALHNAEKALRSIANGSGNPALEAQIALDEINLYHEKELN